MGRAGRAASCVASAVSCVCLRLRPASSCSLWRLWSDASLPPPQTAAKLRSTAVRRAPTHAALKLWCPLVDTQCNVFDLTLLSSVSSSFHAVAVCPSGHLSVFPAGRGCHTAPPGGWSWNHIPLFATTLFLLLFLPGLLRLSGSPRLAVFPRHDARLHSSLLPC